MGIDILKLGEKAEVGLGGESNLRSEDLVQLSCRDYSLGDPGMKIWMMVGYKDRLLFPWWSYDHKLESDVQTLNEIWSVSTPQNLFDCLFLSTLKRFGGPHLFAIFPGNIKTQNWAKIKESDRSVFQKGQGCVYHLQGQFDSKLTINWVPFYQPQSLVRDPSFSSLWRLFAGSQGEDDTNRNLSFFSLSDPSLLPKVVNLLIDSDESRSDRLSELVDWFGLYTSPVDVSGSPCCVVYSKNKETLSRCADIQKSFTGLFEEAKKQLMQSPLPSTVIRLLSRHIAL